MADLFTSVNVSRKQLSDADVVGRIAEVVQRAGIPARQERVPVDPTTGTLRALQNVRCLQYNARLMVKGVHKIRLSLATKLQLLFGAAVVLIIAAALTVPWWRMGGLMDQINERAASAIADSALEGHMRDHRDSGTGVTRPATSRSATTLPATMPGEDRPSPVPRIRAIEEKGKNEHLLPFERRAVRDLTGKESEAFWGRMYSPREGGDVYRYVRPLTLEARCAVCHTWQGNAGLATRPWSAAPMLSPTTGPATNPATRPAAVVGIVSIEMPTQIESAQLLLNNVLLLTAGLLAGTLAIIVFYLITTKLILHPVRVLQEAAEKVSDGDLNIRSDISTGDEFQQLSETFNTMLANLKETEDQLRAINKNLDLKLGQLAETNVALDESNRLKTEFLAAVSHELRTPLNSILGFAELLKDGITHAADGKSVRYVQNILTSGKNLLELINDLLDLAKIEAGRMEVRSEPLSINDLFEGLSSILKPLCEAKGLVIENTIAPNVPIVHTDAAKLQQILYNFLSNAIKFSPVGGVIGLSARRTPDEMLHIAVIDQGPGIPADKQGMIFEKFRQIDGSVTRQHSGTGLGLAISKELVALLGGTIGMQSEEGKGASFWITIPLRIAAAMQKLASAGAAR